jgi:thioredoxin reductase (NADPH)
MVERDVVIIGAGPSGLSAAIFTQLDSWSTLILESNWVGGQGAIAYTVMNYPGFHPGDGAILMESMQKQVTSKPPAGVGAEIRQEKALSLDTMNKVVTTEKNKYRAGTIILATGSTMQKLNVPGEEKFMGRGVSYYAKNYYKMFKDKKIIVVGGGNAAAKSAILAKKEGKASEVIIIHRRGSLRTYPIIKKKLEKEGVIIWYNMELMRIIGKDKVEALNVRDNKTNKESEVSTDWVVICTGTKADIKLAKESGVKIVGDFVEINEEMMTSKKGIFACGEITGCRKHLVNVASEGALAGMAASEYLALEKVRKGETFEGARNGKYVEEYLEMLE